MKWKWLVGSAVLFLFSGTILGLYLAGVFDFGDEEISHGTSVTKEDDFTVTPHELIFETDQKRGSGPTPFVTKDGVRKGWKAVLSSNNSLATPAVVGGKVFLGGGFGSHEFYALDAATGKQLWMHRCKDDGPTAAVVEDSYVVFNTESCELEVLTVAGRPVWKKWLGDPLMSMPALQGGKVYMAFPDSKGDRRHYLACFDVRTGEESWRKPIPGEVITAPVLAEGQVYLATLDGTLSCFRQHDGHAMWAGTKNATSSPVVWNKQSYFSQRQEIGLKEAANLGTRQTERIAAAGSLGQDWGWSETTVAAPYLDASKRRRSAFASANTAADAKVGFSVSKGDAKMAQATANLGKNSVAGVWAYQGSKPFLARGHLYAAMGDTLRCVDARSEKIVWSKTFRPAGPGTAQETLTDSVLTPPVLVNDKVFVATTWGEVYCLARVSGKVHWKVAIGEPIIFQPAVADGRVYVPTTAGSLYCLETGDAQDDGWLMWGAGPGHNGMAD
jgi:Ca-activated chloride channel family protein